MPDKPRNIFRKCLEYKDPQNARAQGFYPYFRRIDDTCGNYVICDGKRRIMVGSNNYLGLAQDDRVIEAACEATRKYGSGCTGSRLLNGNIKLHEQLEEELAHFIKREAVILYSTGYFANLGTIATLVEKGDAVLCDRENHASIVDGVTFSPAKLIPFRHNSATSLANRLQRLPVEAGKLVAIDGVFSMSGDILDLPPIVEVSKAAGASLYVDEAHSLGVVGPGGRGVVHHFGMNGEVDIIMGTFSKSLGSMGGFVAGSSELVNFLKHRARCLIFTASLAPAVAAGVLKALQLLQEEPERIEQLWKNTRKMHVGFKSLGFKIGSTQTPIVPILVGNEALAFKFAQRLYEEGVFATPAIYPAVRLGEAIIRTSYMATHTEEDLDQVLEIFGRVARELGTFDEPAYAQSNSRKNGLDFNLLHQSGSQSLRENAGDTSSNGVSLHSTAPRGCGEIS